MTIKEFSKLCGCNPQTLRYYDRENLLKPVKVDEWSGYRFYEEEQAITFVKIKNLQKARFSIEEIRELLNKDDAEIYYAFETKIAEEEKLLQEIKNIQKTYQTEITNMKNKIEALEIIYNQMYKNRPITYKMINDLYDKLIYDTILESLYLILMISNILFIKSSKFRT